MTRHTNSPIWCVALLLVACGGDASPEVQPTAAEPVEATASSSDLNALGGVEAQAEASAAQSAAVQSVVEPDAEVSSPDISGTHRSAVAPEPITTTFLPV